MARQPIDRYRAQLTAGITDTDLSIPVDSVPTIPAGATVWMTLEDSFSSPTTYETVLIDGVSGSNLTVSARGQNDTTARAWSTSDYISAYIYSADITEKLLKDGDTLVAFAETVTTSTTALSVTGGTIKTYTMASNTTFTDSLSAGQSLTLHLSGGDTYTATWPTMTWVGGSAPTLTADDVIEFWKVGSTLYGAYVGDV